MQVFTFNTVQLGCIHEQRCFHVNLKIPVVSCWECDNIKQPIIRIDKISLNNLLYISNKNQFYLKYSNYFKFIIGVIKNF